MAVVTQAFTGTGTGTVCPALKSGIISISGTFVGTVQVLIDALGTGTFAAAADSTGTAISITTPVAMQIDCGVACNVRVDCTAYTSGTINVAVRSA